MEEQITLDEVYRMLGERDVLIHRLQKELAKLREWKDSMEDVHREEIDRLEK